MFDTFISYRRVGGSGIAARTHDYLKLKGYNPFYDITSMTSGRFDEQLHFNLTSSLNYILILSKGALDRCNDENDWLYKEITTALKYNLNIIVLMEEGFTYPENLSPDLETLKLLQAVEYSEQTLSSRLDLICSSLRTRKSHHEKPVYNNASKTKFKVSGKYVSYYEDVENGHIVMRRAPVILKNYFGFITGRTWFGSSQSWSIRAHLYGKRRLAGTYFAESNIDDGIGTFFLNVIDQNTLEGFWSGYDNENKTLTTGKYIFKRKFNGYTIRKATIADFASIIKIADIQLGKDYLTKEKLEKTLDTTLSDELLVAVQNATGSVIAFSLYKNISYEEVIGLTDGRQIRNMMFVDKIGYLATVATKEGFTGLGIATALVEKSLENMRAQGSSHFVSTAWKHYGIINIESILESAGFRKEIDIPNYWYESSKREGYMCPHCGNPCTCSCVVYTK